MSRSMPLPPEFSEASNGWAWLGIVRCWVIIVAGLLLAKYSLWLWPLAVLVIGLAQYHLTVLGHHATHRNLFNTASLNDQVASWLVLAPLGLPMGLTRQNHFRHHAHFETPDDYEWGIYDMTRHASSPQRFVLWLISIYSGFAFALGVRRVAMAVLSGAGGGQRERRQESSLRDWAVVVLVQLGLLAGFTLVAGWLAYPLLWLLPMVSVMAGLSATRACLEHASVDAPPERLMTFPQGFMQWFVLGPFNFNYHAEHHRYPGVPACHLGRLHRYLVAADNLGETKLCRSYLGRIPVLMKGL